MANARMSISANGAQEFRALAKRLRKTQPDLRKKLRQKIAEAGKPAVDDVKATVRALPVSSHGGGQAQRREFRAGKARTEKAAERARRRGGGLRETIASATRVQQTTKGVRIIVASSRLPREQQTLPRHLDSAKGWRHPVFGNRDNWVHQQGKPYFAATIKRHAPGFRAKVLEAMDEITKQIEG